MECTSSIFVELQNVLSGLLWAESYNSNSHCTIVVSLTPSYWSFLSNYGVKLCERGYKFDPTTRSMTFTTGKLGAEKFRGSNSFVYSVFQWQKNSQAASTTSSTKFEYKNFSMQIWWSVLPFTTLTSVGHLINCKLIWFKIYVFLDARNSSILL